MNWLLFCPPTWTSSTHFPSRCLNRYEMGFIPVHIHDSTFSTRMSATLLTLLIFYSKRRTGESSQPLSSDANLSPRRRTTWTHARWWSSFFWSLANTWSCRPPSTPMRPPPSSWPSSPNQRRRDSMLHSTPINTVLWKSIRPLPESHWNVSDHHRVLPAAKRGESFPDPIQSDLWPNLTTFSGPKLNRTSAVFSWTQPGVIYACA